ncbi:MAG: transposase [Kiritimatiellae bacterium]|nr:transposase [Kiritimatiellia bacterium]
MKATTEKPFPKNYEEFLDWFQTEDDCRDYLEWVRWPNGFACPKCGCKALSKNNFYTLAHSDVCAVL